MKVLIKKSPHERELDGVRLDNMTPGAVREVSASIGAWLIAEGYAEPEMRQRRDEDHDVPADIAAMSPDRRRGGKP